MSTDITRISAVVGKYRGWMLYRSIYPDIFAFAESTDVGREPIVRRRMSEVVDAIDAEEEPF